MKIWMDGDACPKVIKQILYRAAIRTKTPLMIVANHFFSTPTSPFITLSLVPQGFDVADNAILNELQANDLVITGDIILADQVISKGGVAINPRGERYSPETIKQRLAMRNINETLRDSGLIRGGVAPMTQREVQQFSNHLDRLLALQK